jgi:hypothetical protein
VCANFETPVAVVVALLADLEGPVVALVALLADLAARMAYRPPFLGLPTHDRDPFAYRAELVSQIGCP